MGELVGETLEGGPMISASRCLVCWVGLGWEGMAGGISWREL